MRSYSVENNWNPHNFDIVIHGDTVVLIELNNIVSYTYDVNSKMKELIKSLASSTYCFQPTDFNHI